MARLAAVLAESVLVAAVEVSVALDVRATRESLLLAVAAAVLVVDVAGDLRVVVAVRTICTTARPAAKHCQSVLLVVLGLVVARFVLITTMTNA